VQRREGNVLGHQQSGRTSGFKLLSVLVDEETIVAAREEATTLVETDPEFSGSADLRSAVRRLEESEQAEYLEKT
jgi:ATP-dependent DNA helicase RecG